MTIDDEQLNNVCEQSNADGEPEIKADETEPIVEANGAQVKPKHSKAEVAINVALWITIAVLLVAVVLRIFVFGSVEVDGASMNPTYLDADVVVVNKTGTPKRGDVLVFYRNEVDNKFLAQFAKPEECAQGQPYEKLIKRVVALEGDKIWVRHIDSFNADDLYEVVIDAANGDRLTENYYVKKGEKLTAETFYLHSKGITDLGILEGCTEAEPFVVSKGCFFAMGDNRLNSKDSRFFGEFKLTQAFGVVLDK